MIDLSGYEICEQLFKSSDTTIFRGKNKSDNTRVIIKVLNNEYPTADRLENFRREYDITKGLTGDKIIKIYGLENFNNSLAMIMEDFGGKSLADLLKINTFTLEETLALAIDIADALMQIHKQNVIHKDINPYNIIWNIDTNQLKIIDFGISTDLKVEKNQNLSVLEGTLPYISPEQTGKINRIIDYRSDFYSLGVTFYELFTGQLPFTGDELEIAYGHIAKIPKEPKMINSKILPAISDIIMRLLAKNAEERYQSISGLKFDLQYCLENLESREKFINFQTAQKDFSNRFQIPQKLYGREKELEILVKTFEALDTNELGLLLVSGYSGIGKTSVIKEMYKKFINKGGYFVSGKFSHLQRNNPYSAIIIAFRELVRNIISEYKNIEKWKKCIIQALGSNAKIMVSLIPELKQLVGEQPDVSKLNPVEDKNRFMLVFRDFIKVFARREHPLVIFLDDLQWCDFSTTDFLKYILTSMKVDNLLIIGAYRDNEVTKDHPLLLMLDEVKDILNGSGFLNQIILEPLSQHAVNQMVADTLKCPYSDTYVLTSYIYRKTKGNPFFTKQLLNSLYQKGVFNFDEAEVQWKWNLNKIDEVQVSDNVAGFLIQTLNLLPQDSLEVIKKASCIGNPFDLKTLYLISSEFETITDALWVTIEKDLILPFNNNYKLSHMTKEEFIKSDIEIKFRFSHDRIQQAAYSLISDSDRLLIHKKIGKILLDLYTNQNKLDNNIFEVTNHLNIARDLADEKSDRINLMNLNYKAGKISKASTAYDLAKNYFKIGKALLTEEEWNDYPEKLFELSFEFAEANFLSGNIEEAFKLCTDLFEVTSGKIEKVRIVSLKAKILDNRGENKALVIDEVRKGLKLLGIDLPVDVQEIHLKLGEGINKMQVYSDKSQIEGLLSLPRMTDENKIMAMRLFFQVQPAAYAYYPPLNFLIQTIMFDMTLSYGITEVSCKNIAECGIIQGSLLNNYEMAYQFGKASFALLKKLDYEPYAAGCYFIFATFISHWKVHYSESLSYYDLCFKSALETGDMEHAVYSCTHRFSLTLYSGKNLNDCRAEAENSLRFFKEVNIALLEPSIRIFLHTIKQLQSSYNFENENYLLEETIQSENMWFLCIFGQCNLMINYLLGDIEAADKWNIFTKPYLRGGTGFFPMPDHYMFQSLMLLKKYEKSAEKEKERIIETVVKNLESLKVWSDSCPSNFSHKYNIVRAELSRIRKEPLEIIMSLYKEALDSINPGNFIHMRALINELIGEFWISRNEEFIGKVYIKEAYYFYSQWGAFSKIRLLEKKYTRFFTDFNKLNLKFANPNKRHISTKYTEALSLDLGSILKSTQAISSEIKIDKLLKVLMNTIIENAGAQSGCLILKRDTRSSLFVEALKCKDSEEIQVMKSIPFNESYDFCPEIVQYVVSTRENIVLDNASNNPNFQNNMYVIKNKTKSILCMPIIYQNDLKGIIYLENNLMENVFTIERIETLKIISTQIAISIENAQLYVSLEEKVRDRTQQLELANKELKELALHDPLTRLHNRRYVYEYISGLSESFVKSKAAVYFNRQKRDLSLGNNVIGVYLIDIDFFKNVNDTYGHAIGDEVLVKITNVLKNIIRDDDYIIRWGGEEFLIILNKTKIEYLKVFSKKVLDIVSKTPIELMEGQKIYITCSIGCTFLPFEPELSDLFTLEQTINISDLAMYKAKERGRNRAVHVHLQNLSNYSKEEIKKYLMSLKRNSEIDEKFFTFEEIE
jgi:diguanylate cyclase (GGDEF)-like protein